MLRVLEARIGRGFELPERDRAALDGVIGGLAEAANAVLAAVRDGATAAGLDGRLAAFGQVLDRHLLDEEELVVPVALDHPEAGLERAV